MTDFGIRLAHHARHEDGGADEVDATGLVGRCLLVDRGDLAAYDWTTGVFTTDALWHPLDCSAKVPVGTTHILFNLVVKDDLTSQHFFLRKYGNANNYNAGRLYTMVANEWAVQMMIVACDADRKVEYVAANTTWANIYLTVLGYFV